MIQSVSINTYQISNYTEFTITNHDLSLENFPLLSIDTDSYISRAEIQSGIDFDIKGNRHCLMIGKMCSLADSIKFLIDLNHDYKTISQGAPSFLKNAKWNYNINRKGSILLQNDVWIGHGVTIMGGVTLHNGCVVGANSIVTKDIPPYAIVAGNPAKVLHYRFDRHTICGLQKIAWWNWPKEIQIERREDFFLNPQIFVNKYIEEAENKMNKLTYIDNIFSQRIKILLIPDINHKYPLYPKILKQFLEKDHSDTELIIYLSENDSTLDNIDSITNIINRYEETDNYITLQTGTTLDEHILFQYADYYITTRDSETINRTCLADLYNVKVLYGTDEPMFSSLLF